MKEEHLIYVVALNWYEGLKKATVELQEMHDNGIICFDSITEKHANKYYENLNGFLWGLNTIGYISDELRKEYTEQLIEMF